jgi:pilus assembly protein Flp/PilA
MIKFAISFFTQRTGTVAQLAGSRRSNSHQRGLIMTQLISRFFKDQTAATAIEYSLIAGGIALAIVGVVQALGTQVKVPFTTMSAALK